MITSLYILLIHGVEFQMNESSYSPGWTLDVAVFLRTGCEHLNFGLESQLEYSFGMV